MQTTTLICDDGAYAELQVKWTGLSGRTRGARIGVFTEDVKGVLDYIGHNSTSITEHAHKSQRAT